MSPGICPNQPSPMPLQMNAPRRAIPTPAITRSFPISSIEFTLIIQGQLANLVLSRSHLREVVHSLIWLDFLALRIKKRRMNSGVIEEIRAKANQISRLVTELHPLAGNLGEPNAQAETLRALFELTKQVEVVKKQLLRIEKNDSSKLV